MEVLARHYEAHFPYLYNEKDKQKQRKCTFQLVIIFSQFQIRAYALTSAITLKRQGDGRYEIWIIPDNLEHACAIFPVRKFFEI